jgi:hypothetical protein
MLVGYGKNPPNPPYRINAGLMANWTERYFMTIRFPARTFCDSILSSIGKRRAVFIPPAVMGKYGIYAATKEPFLRALVRPRNQAPPEGWFYPDDIMLRGNDHD